MDVCAETRRPIITYLQRVNKLIPLFIDDEEEDEEWEKELMEELKDLQE